MSTVPEPRTMVVYGRPGCHLCEVAKEALTPILAAHGVRLEERNVEDRVEWEARYGDQVPVGFLGAAKVFKYRVDPVRLEAAIRSRN